MNAPRPKLCYGPEKGKHKKGCRPGRPLCRWSRKARGVCSCDAYHYPHRDGSLKCRVLAQEGVPLAILLSPSYQRSLVEHVPENHTDENEKVA